MVNYNFIIKGEYFNVKVKIFINEINVLWLKVNEMFKKLFFKCFKEELVKFDWNCCKIVFRELYFLVYIKGLVYN